jgi:hypothetical protein
MPKKDDAPVGSSEVDDIVSRFLRGEGSLEEAAQGIAEFVPRDEVWGLGWDADTSPKDAARLRQLFWRVARLADPDLDEYPE